MPTNLIATATATPVPAKATAAIPRFVLYGEADSAAPELLHIEEVQSRSRLYHWEIDPHVHQGLFQVLWVREGAVTVVLDEWRGAVTGPCACLIPPGVVHGFSFAPETDGLVLTVSPRFLVDGDAPPVADAFRTLFATPAVLQMPADDGAAARLSALFRELVVEFVLAGTVQSPVVGWLARSVVWRLAQARADNAVAHTGRANRHHALFTRFLQLLESHFLEHWSLLQYAQTLGLTTQRLNRLAQAESGRPALEWVHERLTREACRRLLYIAAPASSLAQELGFDDPAYFSRFFKRRTGASPRQWRLAQMARD